MKLLRFFAVTAVVVAGLMVQPAVAAQGDYTLIVAPARFSVIQVAFDLIKKRPSVLVSYRGEASTTEPQLYAWNGAEWVGVSLQDYRDVRFLQDSPKQVVLLGDENTLPKSLREATGWAKNIQIITSLDNASLVNEFGRLFKWTAKEWNWFSARYNLKLQDESEPYRHSSWYDQPGPLTRDAGSKVLSAPPAFEPSAPDKVSAPDMPPAPIKDAPAEKTPPANLPASTPVIKDVPAPAPVP